jgi:hypothetical protein
LYYLYYFNKPDYNKRPDFVFSHNRHNEFNLNLGYLKGAYNVDRVRANLALAAGTYMNSNYAAEPGGLKNIYEANAGIKLCKKKDLWLDAGIFSSHIGFESAHSPGCWSLTRSILADNSPYYEAGAKLTFTSENKKWLLSLLALNGWQRIQRVEGNSLISWGTQAQYKPSEELLLNYSTFIGTDKTDSARLMRYFHNLYSIFNLSNKVGLILGFDIGMEEKNINNDDFNYWYSPVGILKYSINSNWSLTARLEYYSDKNGVIISTGTPNGFQTTGYSFNIDYKPKENVSIRLEGRNFNSKDKMFLKNNQSTNNNPFITVSLAVGMD